MRIPHKLNKKGFMLSVWELHIYPFIRFYLQTLKSKQLTNTHDTDCTGDCAERVQLCWSSTIETVRRKRLSSRWAKNHSTTRHANRRAESRRQPAPARQPRPARRPTPCRQTSQETTSHTTVPRKQLSSKHHQSSRSLLHHLLLQTAHRRREQEWKLRLSRPETPANLQ